jgi:pimeloyl-ACP methyl ester carboxylesterase
MEALYSRSEWTQLGTARIKARAGDGSGLLSLADEYYRRYANGQYSNLIQAYIAISCNDSQSGPPDSAIRATARRWVSDYPLFGRWSASSLFACQQWQPARTVPPKPTAATSTKVLVIGNVHDPATPYQGAKDLTTTMGNAELLTWNGEGHTSYLRGSSCIDQFVDSYLISRILPPDGTTCPR